MPEIEVSRVAEDRFSFQFHVQVVDGGNTTEYHVTLSRVDHERLGSAFPSPEAFIQACFEFLLERESSGSILRSFDVSQISTYFPEFDREIIPNDQR